MLNDGFMLVADNKKERGSEIHDLIRQGVRDAQDYLKKVKFTGSIHDVTNEAQEVLSDLKAVLNDPDRNAGEFQWAIGKNDEKLAGSARLFTPSGGKFIDGSEKHASITASLQGKGFGIVDVIHTHPNEPGMATNNFSEDDIMQVGVLQGMNPRQNVRSFLLTPDNYLLVYSPSDSKEHPKGEEVGFFLKNGQFVCTNDRYKEFKSTR